MSTFFTSAMDTMRKQSKKDEAIRKRTESGLARKRTISWTHVQRPSNRGGKPAAAKSTVASLRPSAALTVPENITVAEASQLCAAKRMDFVLVVDDEEGLSGIFTATDLAYRLTAEGLDPHTTQVHQIMTRNPFVTRDTTNATDVLQLMVSKHFRHLPVCNEEGNIVGLLDITKVFHEALAKVERSSVASEQLLNAITGVQSELGAVDTYPQVAAILAWAEKLREKTALPDLTTVIDSHSQPAIVGPKTTVREVAKLMKERRATAVCVTEPPSAAIPSAHPRIIGIFTSKDVVLRVIAAGLDAGRCSVVRVMTPHPDTAPSTLNIHDALKKMHNGHYLNLPVLESDGRLVAIVDVLKLTYAVLEQMNAMSGDGLASDNEGGPMWGNFFDSVCHEDVESLLSGSHHSDLRSFPSMPDMSHLQSPNSEIHLNDSASVVDEGSGAPRLTNQPEIEGEIDAVDNNSITVTARRSLELMTDFLIMRAAELTNQPDFHGIDHFTHEFGKLIKRNPQVIELDIEDWEQTLRPLLNALEKLLVPSKIDTLMDQYCQQCRFFQMVYDILMHLKSLREKEEPDVEKYLTSLEEIMKYGSFDMNFGRVLFGSAAVVGSLMAVLAHQRYQ